MFEGSAMYIGDPEEGYESHAICAPAVFEPGKCELSISGECKYMDYGMDLYAPQTNLDKDGRMLHSCTVDGYRLDETGAWIE